MRRAVYAGSFDPVTNGHLWMIQRGAALFDELVVAVGENPEKSVAFSLDERLAMLRESVGDVAGVTVAHFANAYLVQYARAMGAEYILRGIRDGHDYEYERGMRQVNADLHPEVTTVFLIPPRDLAEISSSLVKGLIGPEGWEAIIPRYVPASVAARLIARGR